MTTYRYSVKTENPFNQESGTRTITAASVGVDPSEKFVVFADEQDDVVAMVRIDHVASVTRKAEVGDTAEQEPAAAVPIAA